MTLPFAGIAERPYDNMLTCNVDWKGIELEPFLYKDIWLTQNRLTILGMFSVQQYSTDLYPHLVLYQGNLYLEDGHHRVIKRALLGHIDGPMRLLDWADIDENENETNKSHLST